ncbi:hypothetical protein ACFQ0T_00500 [Kitasatospora gansuensis]
MRVRTLITVAAVVVAVAGSTAGRSAVADANLYADTLIMQVNQQMAAPVGLREFSFVVKSDRITNRDFKGTLRCSARFDVQRVGDASQPGFVGGYLKVGFYVGFAGTRVSCDGEVAGDTIAGRTRKTSVICRPARELRPPWWRPPAHRPTPRGRPLFGCRRCPSRAPPRPRGS